MTIDITGWSAVSPYGLGTEAFAAAVRSQQPAMSWADPVGPAGMTARLVPGFDQRAVLGKKGTKGMDRLTGLAVTAVGQLLTPAPASGPTDRSERCGERERASQSPGRGGSGGPSRPGGSSGEVSEPTRGCGERERASRSPGRGGSGGPSRPGDSHGRGGAEEQSEPDITALVLGTNSGSAKSMMDFTRTSLTAERPFDVDPAAIPSVVMNCAAGQCAIWHGLTGPNTTIAGGRVAGLLGLAYARRLLRAGRAGSVLCGAAEEYSAARSWLEFHAGQGARTLGEGAAVLRLEPAGTPGALATVLAVDSLVGGGRNQCRYEIKRVLGFAGVTMRQVWAIVTGSGEERAALDGMFEPGVLTRIPPVADLVGDAGAVSCVFGIAAALAVGAAEPAPRIAVIAGTDPTGTAAAAVLRLHAA